MASSTARTIAEDQPVELTSLNQALESFRLSYRHTQVVLSIFDTVLNHVYVYRQSHPEAISPEDHQRYIHEPWQRSLKDLRDRYSDSYSDPESLQAAQMMAKQDSVRIWCELEAHVRRKIFVGDPADCITNIGQWYTKVRRGTKWLVECAIIGLSDKVLQRHDKDTATANLKALATCGPRYGSAELIWASGHRDEIFGPGGALWSVMEVFTRDPEDYSGIVGVLDMVFQQALNVALIFKYSWEGHARTHYTLPPYKWYETGLNEALKKFTYLVECQDPRALISYHVRDGLKDVNFVEIWDGLWQKAYDLCRSPGFDPHHLDLNLYLWVAQQMKLPSSDPRPWTPRSNVAAITTQRCGEYGLYDVEGVMYKAPNSFAVPPDGLHMPMLSNTLDVETILYNREPSLEYRGWGHRFYDMDDEFHFADSREEEIDASDADINDAASVEPYGPFLDPNEVADVATTKPEDQRCTICIEDHFYSYSDGRTMKLNTCGHFFHYECIFDWLNGSSSNSNLCPECRVQFSEERRPVRLLRPALASQPSSTSPPSSRIPELPSSPPAELRRPIEGVGAVDGVELPPRQNHEGMSFPWLEEYFQYGMADLVTQINTIESLEMHRGETRRFIDQTNDDDSEDSLSSIEQNGHTSTSTHQASAAQSESAEETNTEHVYRQFTSGTSNGYDLVMDEGSREDDDACEAYNSRHTSFPSLPIWNTEFGSLQEELGQHTAAVWESRMRERVASFNQGGNNAF